MGGTCNNLCNRYKAKKPNNIGRYLSGQKRCNSCDVYINWDGLWCPCCNYKDCYMYLPLLKYLIDILFQMMPNQFRGTTLYIVFDSV